MKVICIDGSTDKDSPLPINVVEGEIYTVVQVIKSPKIDWYILSEMGQDDQYSSDGFVPVSDIDESKFIREYNKEFI